MALQYSSIQRLCTNIHYIIIACLLYSLYYNTLFFNDFESNFLNCTKTKHITSNLCLYMAIIQDKNDN